MRFVKTEKFGFTIIELLVVVVVIAILATITTFAYRGITQRAEATRVLAAFDAYEKAIRMYHVEHGTWPSTRTGPNTSVYTCLGGDYPATADLEENNCLTLKNGSTTFPFTMKLQSVDDDLKAYLGTLPSIDYKTYSVTSGSTSQYVRGIIYESILNDPPKLMYYIPAEGTCGRGVKSSQDGILFAACELELRS